MDDRFGGDELVRVLIDLTDVERVGITGMIDGGTVLTLLTSTKIERWVAGATTDDDKWVPSGRSFHWIRCSRDDIVHDSVCQHCATPLPL
mmetsp:Transcript_2636/g.4297  ORF Transcript_2636/g.4297 Transcript_2636/m.4297 type:complete len:90 (+) Transcript_2636:138-407(+)